MEAFRNRNWLSWDNRPNRKGAGAIRNPGAFTMSIAGLILHGPIRPFEKVA